MAGVVEQVARLLTGVELYALLQQVFVDIDNATAWENFVELVALQLVITSSTTHHHSFNVEVVQRISHAVEQHTVVGDDFFSLVKLPAAALRITTTQIPRWQNSLYARMPQHGLGGESYLTEQAL